MKEIVIGNNIIGDEHGTFVIAEIGANWKFCDDAGHNYKHAIELIDIAREAGADAVKFQVYRAEKLYVSGAGKAGYLKSEKSIYDIIKDKEIPYGWLGGLKEYCDKKGIIFLATPFDEESAAVLESMRIEAYKIASYTITHIPFLKTIARYNKPIILSTGASEFSDIERAVTVIKKAGNNSIALMQCTAKYPAPLETINLKVIPYLKSRFDVPVGLSDHSRDALIAPLGAVALGANLVEKHFTTSNDLEGPDHIFAVLPKELKEMIDGIRAMERTLGSGRKDIQCEEQELYKFCRTKIYAAKDIAKGKLLTPDMLAILRSGNAERGLEPSEYQKILNKKAMRDIKKDTPINWDMIA